MVKTYVNVNQWGKYIISSKLWQSKVKTTDDKLCRKNGHNVKVVIACGGLQQAQHAQVILVTFIIWIWNISFPRRYFQDILKLNGEAHQTQIYYDTILFTANFNSGPANYKSYFTQSI